MIPAVPSFAVDAGFWYSVPRDRTGEIGVGSLVRVPLGGRRTRGYVVETSIAPPRPIERLRPVGPLVMKLPVFDRQLLDALIWAANRYVAPVSVLLDRATPPNLVNRASEPGPPSPRQENVDHPLTPFARAIAHRNRRPPTAFLGTWWELDWLAALATPILGNAQSMLVVVATTSEATALGNYARDRMGDGVEVVTSDSSDAVVTAAWANCQAPGRLLIGTPRVASWHITGLRLIVAIEEGRRAMKDRQTPTISVRDIFRTRAGLAGLGLVFVGPTPTVETVASGASIVRRRRRAWPAVEVVDRRQQQELTGFIGLTALGAIKAVSRRGGSVFVFAHRRGYAPAFRCRRCQTLRRCPRCGSRPEPGTVCARCGETLGSCVQCGGDQFLPLGAGIGRLVDELAKKLDQPTLAQVTVGSEADLASIDRQDLVVAVDADGLILGTHYRASEEALRILARLVGKVGGPASRGLIQTTLPDHPVIWALRAGDPIEFLTSEIDTRQKLGLPPAGQLLVVETRGTTPPTDDLRGIVGTASLLGPVARVTSHGEAAQRWLVQGRDLGPVRLQLRALVQQWREGGTVVRIDSDPIDL